MLGRWFEESVPVGVVTAETRDRELTWAVTGYLSRPEGSAENGNYTLGGANVPSCKFL